MILLQTALGQGTLAFFGLLLAAILGFILGYIYWRRQMAGVQGQIDGLRAELQHTHDEKNALSGKLNGCQQKLDRSEQKALEAESALQEAQTRLASLQSDRDSLKEKNDAYNLQVRELESKYRQASVSLDPYQTRINQLEGQNKRLNTRVHELEPLEGKFQAYVRESDSLKIKLARLLNKEKDLKAEVASLKQKLNEAPKAAPLSSPAPSVSSDELQQELTKLKKENTQLRTRFAAEEAQSLSLKEKIAKLEAKQAQAQAQAEAQAQAQAQAQKAAAEQKAKAKPAPKEAAPPNDKKEVLARIQQKAEKLNFDRIGTASASEKDDLKVIKGIGPFIEEKLNALNIYTYKQIANFNEADEEQVNEAIEFFPGRVKRDAWVLQAKGLLGDKKAAEEATLIRLSQRAEELDFDTIGKATEADKDDLKLIKGVGPFLEKKLNSLGIYTFKQIAKFTPALEEKVNEVIEFFPGRIKRDEWVKQAQAFAKAKEKK
jgi:predicted flap endonuclease-1-like 5' DNA nuclease